MYRDWWHVGILGIKLKKRTRIVVLGYDDDGGEISLTLRAPRLSEVDGLDALFPEVVPPILKDERGRNRVARGDNGKVQTDQYGSPIVLRNPDDAAYKAAEHRRSQAMTIAMVVGCAGDQIKPSKTPEDFKGDLIEYYHAIWDELEHEGLDVGHFKSLVAAAMELGRPMSKPEVVSARKQLGTDEATQKEIKAGLVESAKARGEKAAVPAGK